MEWASISVPFEIADDLVLAILVLQKFTQNWQPLSVMLLEMITNPFQSRCSYQSQSSHPILTQLYSTVATTLPNYHSSF